jgi:hypothetical protein
MVDPNRRNNNLDRDDVATREGLEVDPHETQHPGFRPGRHEVSAHDVSSRLNTTAARDGDSRAEGGDPSLSKTAAADDYAHRRGE